MFRADDDDQNQRDADDITPLNLSKSGGNSENDSDSLENMRKEDVRHTFIVCLHPTLNILVLTKHVC